MTIFSLRLVFADGRNQEIGRLRVCKCLIGKKIGLIEIAFFYSDRPEDDAKLERIFDPLRDLSDSIRGMGLFLNMNKFRKELSIALVCDNQSNPPMMVVETAKLAHIEPAFREAPWIIEKTAIIRIAPRDKESADDLIPLQRCHAELKKCGENIMVEFAGGMLLIALPVREEI